MPEATRTIFTDLSAYIPMRGFKVSLNGGRTVGWAHPIVGGEPGTVSVEITDPETIGLLRKGAADRVSF